MKTHTPLSTIASLLLAATLVGGCMSSEGPTGGVPTEGPTGGIPGDLAWMSADIGNVEVPGNVSSLAESGGFQVRASGRDIWGTADSFHFYYAVVPGDVVVTARVESLAWTDGAAKAGVMIRSDLSPSAAHAFMGITPARVDEFISRPAAGMESVSTLRSSPGLPTWLRLRREGDTVVASVSEDGVSWQEMGTVQLPLDDEIYVGVAVTSRNPDTVTEAQLGLLTLADESEAEPVAPAPELPSDTSGDYVGPWVCPEPPLEPQYEPTLYVAATGLDSNDGRSPSSPLRTLQAAANVAAPGDVVWVRGGQYSARVSFTQSGSADRPIVFESYPGECAVLDGSVGTPGKVQFVGVEHVVFRNFVVRNSPGEGIWMQNSSNNEISHVRTHDNFWSGITVVFSDQNRFRYIIAHDNYDPPGGGDADGITISSGDRNYLGPCIAFGNSDDGVDTWFSTNTVVERCVSFENGWQGGNGVGFKIGGGFREVHATVRNSIAFGNRTHGFDTNSSIYITFDHVTAFGNGGWGISADTSNVRNSLSFGNGSRDFADWGSNTEVTNSWNLGISDPAFMSVNPQAEDFLSLATSSRAVDAGTPIGQSYSGSAPDLGALGLGETVRTLIGISLAEVIGD